MKGRIWYETYGIWELPTHEKVRHSCLRVYGLVQVIVKLRLIVRYDLSIGLADVDKYVGQTGKSIKKRISEQR